MKLIRYQVLASYYFKVLKIFISNVSRLVRGNRTEKFTVSYLPKSCNFSDKLIPKSKSCIVRILDKIFMQ